MTKQNNDMEINKTVTQTTSGLFSPVAMAFIQSSVEMMIPWLIVMFAVIAADLVAGIRKSLKLGIHVSVSTAVRETMGKMVTYFAFVVMACMIDVAANGECTIAKWACMFVCCLEGFSIIGNFLKPYGIDLSMKGMVKVFARRVINVTDEEAEELLKQERVDVIKKRENEKWNKR